MRDPNHDCPNTAAPATSQRLDALHRTQSGGRRHRCVACAYAAGYEAGRPAADADRRVSSWSIEGRAEMCEEGRSAPEATLRSLPENQGEHRWRCAACAWTPRPAGRRGVRPVRQTRPPGRSRGVIAWYTGWLRGVDSHEAREQRVAPELPGKQREEKGGHGCGGRKRNRDFYGGGETCR